MLKLVQVLLTVVVTYLFIYLLITQFLFVPYDSFVLFFYLFVGFELSEPSKQMERVRISCSKNPQGYDTH